MSIKDRGKKYAEFLDFLRKEYIAKYGKEAEGLADTMLKRKAAEKVDEMMKVIPFPEGKITDWTKDRPKTGPKADVKTFPKQKKLTPETEGLGSFDKLKKELEEMEKLGQPYKDTSVSDFLSDYFDMPQKAPPKKTITELNNVKLYGDETFDELQIIKDTGEHPRDKKANGGRIGYAEGMSAEEAVAGRLPTSDLVQQLQESILKRSPDGIVMEGMQDTTTLDMLRDALKGAPKTPSVVEYDDGTLYYPEFDEYYKEDGKQVEGPAFWAKPIPKLFEVPKHSERKSIDLANGGRIGFKFGTGKRAEGIKSILEEINKKLKKTKNKGEVVVAKDLPPSPKVELQRMFDDFNKRLKEKNIKKQSKETYEKLRKEEPERMAEFDEMWEDPEKFAPNKDRLLTDDEIRDYEEVLGDSETWMTKGTLGEADEAVKRQIDYEKQMYAEYKVDKQSRKELEQAYNEIDFRMTGEDTKYEANELADMLAETRYKTEMSDLPQKTQIDLYGEAYDYLMEVKRDAANFKGAVDIKSGKNIVTGEQELPLDPMTGKPRKLNAQGGLNYLMGL